jgi:hypothetical protein
VQSVTPKSLIHHNPQNVAVKESGLSKKIGIVYIWAMGGLVISRTVCWNLLGITNSFIVPVVWR